jgi:3-oxoacyl-[acyl-carrier-protein] synthase III
MTLPIHIHGIASALGDPHPINALESFSDPSRGQVFSDMGFREVRSSTTSVANLAGLAMARSLERAPVDPGQIGVVVYCSSSLSDDAHPTELHAVCANLRLHNAYPIGVHLSYCGNLGSGLRVASSLLHVGDAEFVLLVCADKSDGIHDPARLMEPGVGITSDGAACCVLSATRPSRMRLRAMHQYVDHGLSDIPLEEIYAPRTTLSADFMRYAFQTCSSRRSAAQALLKSAGIEPTDVDTLITNNYGLNTLKTIASDAGVDFDKVFRDNVATNGHVHAADNLINLATCAETGRKFNGLLLSTGPYSGTFWLVEAS